MQNDGIDIISGLRYLSAFQIYALRHLTLTRFVKDTFSIFDVL